MRKFIPILFTIFSFLFVFTITAQEYNAMLNNGLKLADTPYGAGMLEVNDNEELEINGDALDCVTFVEFALAMSLCEEQGSGMSEIEFAHHLQKIRYRNGIINGYASRLHYATDWINDNIKKGILEDVTAKNSDQKMNIFINYMSTHADQYKQLRRSPAEVSKMADIERQISGKAVHYLPKDKLPNEGLKWIKNGDIIAITTNSPGLDVSHMGMAIYMKNNLHLLHASSKEGKVTVERIALASQLERNKDYTGIRVLRLKK